MGSVVLVPTTNRTASPSPMASDKHDHTPGRQPAPSSHSDEERHTGGASPTDATGELVGTEVRLVADDPNSEGVVVQETDNWVQVEGALVDGKYFAGWVPRTKLVDHSG